GAEGGDGAGQAAAKVRGPAARGDGARAHRDDAGGDLLESHLQLHDQRQRSAAGRATACAGRRSRHPRRAAGGRVHDRLARPARGRQAHRSLSAQVGLPADRAQAPLFLLAAPAGGWPLYVTVVAFMIFVFGAIPFVDAMIVQYVDDRMRSRVAGMRLTVSFGVASLAVYVLGPTVKAAGFGTLLTVM